MTDVRALAQSWLSLAEAGQELGVKPGKVHRLVEDRCLGTCELDGERRIPVDFLEDGQPLAHLRGTLILLGDLGLSDDEATRWMLTPNDALEGRSPAQRLRTGSRAEVRRVAQLLG